MTARQPRRNCSVPDSGTPAIVRDVVRTPGTPLPARESSRFGHDFSSVRVHADAEAAASARAVHARAFTLGEHVVFGANEFAPHTQRGQELLEHELGHVAEQRAGAPVEIARMPDDADSGPPLDDTKILIDAVPEILQSSLSSAPKTVKVKVSDPNVKSIKWTLTAPDGSIVDSVKTNPANPAAKTRAFDITARHISGATGRYHLRCDGLDAKDQARAYGIRDFNVVASDLATGTPTPGSSGTLTFTEYRGYPAAGTQKAYLHATLRFMPDKSVNCKEILFVQSVQPLEPGGVKMHGKTSPELKDRASAEGWAIDQDRGRSPFYNVSDVPGVATLNVGRGGPSPAPTELDDKPEGSLNQPSVVRFETCAICREANPKQVFGCATWGFTWDGNLGSTPVPLPRSFSNYASDEFRGAAKGWNDWLKRTAGKGTP